VGGSVGFRFRVRLERFFIFIFLLNFFGSREGIVGAVVVFKVLVEVG
jgi:hypothetical protein